MEPPCNWGKSQLAFEIRLYSSEARDSEPVTLMHRKKIPAKNSSKWDEKYLILGMRVPIPIEAASYRLSQFRDRAAPDLICVHRLTESVGLKRPRSSMAAWVQCRALFSPSDFWGTATEFWLCILDMVPQTAIPVLVLQRSSRRKATLDQREEAPRARTALTDTKSPMTRKKRELRTP